MFKHDKKLMRPVKVERPNPQYANLMQETLGGANGEVKAAMQYLSQSFRAEDPAIKDLFLDIGTEELGHLEMVGSIVYQLSDGATGKDWLNGKTPEYYADNGNGVFPQNAQGSPFNAASIAVTGDPITNLFEDLAADGAIT